MCCINAHLHCNSQTTEQAALNGRQVSWPRGKVLGGSSAINGLYLTRAAKLEYDAWDSLQNDSMYSWDWDAVYPYLKVFNLSLHIAQVEMF